MAKFTPQHYNAIAKEIRELFPINDAELALTFGDDSMTRASNMEKRSILTVLALNLARRFKDDNERFDPLRFLDACSPNTDMYPLSELWKEDEKGKLEG